MVNTCHSGRWNEVAVALGLANVDSNVTVLARCQAEDEIWSHKESESMCTRGGYFVNCLTGELYKEYDLFLPRPTQVKGQEVKGQEVIRFEETNLTAQSASSATRARTTDTATLIDETRQDMITLLPEQVPQC